MGSVGDTCAVRVEVLEATARDGPVLRQLLELYRHDFSEFDGSDVDEHGLYGYRHLDDYLGEPGRHSFLIKVDARWAGFALVRTLPPHDMTEFFVMRKYRRLGVGREVARQVFERFPGEWQVRQMASNPAATTFWRAVIPVQFDEDVREDGPLQRFVIR